MSYCLLSFILVGMFLGVPIFSDRSLKQKFIASLNEKQKQSYKQQKQLFIQGLIIGGLLGLGYAFIGAGKMPASMNACIVITITLGFAYLWYMIRKPMYLIESKQVYLDEQRSAVLGILVGLAAYFSFVLITGRWGVVEY